MYQSYPTTSRRIERIRSLLNLAHKRASRGLVFEALLKLGAVQALLGPSDDAELIQEFATMRDRLRAVWAGATISTPAELQEAYLGKARSTAPTPSQRELARVGQLATEAVGSDRYPYTVIEVQGGGSRIVLQARKSRRADSNGLCEDQRWMTVEDPQGRTMVATWRPSEGHYRVRGLRAGQGGRVKLGHADCYLDPSF